MVLKYFLDEVQQKTTGSTCYFEFQKGKFKNKFWLNDSLYLHADIFDSLMLFDLFSNSMEDFYYYGPTEVNKQAWENLAAKSAENEHWKAVMKELNPWAEECFAKYNCFTVCGI